MCFFSSAVSVSPCNCWPGQKPRANPFPARVVTRYIFRAWFFAESHSRLVPRRSSPPLQKKNTKISIKKPAIYLYRSYGTQDGGENEINRFLFIARMWARVVWSMTLQRNPRYHRSKLSFDDDTKFSFAYANVAKPVANVVHGIRQVTK